MQQMPKVTGTCVKYEYDYLKMVHEWTIHAYSKAKPVLVVFLQKKLQFDVLPEDGISSNALHCVSSWCPNEQITPCKFGNGQSPWIW